MAAAAHFLRWILALFGGRFRRGRNVDDGGEPIAEDELLYRRISEKSGWYDESTGEIDPQAFAPHPTEDRTGLSVSRAKYKTISQAAIGWPGKRYFVAILRAVDLVRAGISISPEPTSDDPGHAVLPDLNSGNRKEDRTESLQETLASLTIDVDGPFPKAGGETG